MVIDDMKADSVLQQEAAAVRWDALSPPPIKY